MTNLPEKSRLAEVFRTEYSRLIGFVRRRVDHMATQDAEDFVHDVAVHLFNQGDISAPVENLSAYVYRSLSNRIADYFRKRRRMQTASGTHQGIENISFGRVIEERRRSRISED